MKGAPECIFKKCSTIALKDKNVKFTNEMKSTADNATENLAKTGKLLR